MEKKTMKILLATDGSSASESVVEAACRAIGDPENTQVKIISVIEPTPPLAAGPFALSAEYYEEIDSQANEQARNSIAQADKNLKANCPQIGAVSHEILHGIAAQEIIKSANEWGADLIVVGSHGYGFWSRAILGSVSNAVVHQASCSVLIVRGK